MSNKFKSGLYGASALLGSALSMIAAKAHAASLFTVPTSTVDSAMAYVSGQLSDPGTLTILVAVIALGVIFYVAGRLIGLFGRKK